MRMLLDYVGTLTPSRLAVAGLAVALGALAGCHDDSSPNLPPIIPVPNSIAVADVNGDGEPDLVVATTADQGYQQNPGYADVILNTSGSLGTFKPGVHYSTTGTNPSSIAVGNLTGSGGPDLVIANFGSGSVSVFMHEASGTYSNAVDWPTGGQPNQVVISDLAGTGNNDLVLADMSASGNVIVLMGDGTGKFGTPTKLPTGLTTPSVAVGDLGSGVPDIVAAVYDSSGNNGAVMVFYQDPQQRGTFPTQASSPAGAQPQSVKIADVNGDGLPDIIVANFGPGSDGAGTAGVSVLLQDKANPGKFLAPVPYATPGASIDVAVGDLDGDGKLDIVVANLAPNATGSVSVLLQDPTPANRGKFLAATNYAALGQPLSVVLADLNKDGHLDIAIADGPSAGVLMNQGAGTFGPATQVGF